MLLCCCCPESTLEDHIAAAVQQHKPRLAHRSGREPLSCLSRMAEHPLSNPPQSRDPHGCHTVPHRDQTAAHLLIQLLRHVRSNNKAVRSLPQTVHEWQRPMINKKTFYTRSVLGGTPFHDVSDPLSWWGAYTGDPLPRQQPQHSSHIFPDKCPGRGST